ncbi:MAG: putative DNA modification/repair radical SAM protein [Marinilabiliaceae bacterium]
MDKFEKLKILASAAKYDVSCATSGSARGGNNGLGSAVAAGVCHSFADDGRCISLLKVLFTNHCIYDCAYCANRRSNDIPRAAFTPEELADITINFYRRNYIEGLFLSSGVMHSPDYTMARLTRVVRQLREVHGFNGYIHLKAIPGADEVLIREAGFYADRMSVNIEIPSEDNLKYLAPEKDYNSVLTPMHYIHEQQEEYRPARQNRKSPKFVPAGQSTQLIVGATPDSDNQVLHLASSLYTENNLKRVYYSGYIHTNMADTRLPALSAPPLRREHRLYQADWLMRFYEFKVDEIVDDAHPDLDLEIDPKLAYALRHPEFFPVDIQKADLHQLLRVPGIGPKSARLILSARRHGQLSSYLLKKMGVVMKRARFFITCRELTGHKVPDFSPDRLRMMFLDKSAKQVTPDAVQLKLF